MRNEWNIGIIRVSAHMVENETNLLCDVFAYIRFLPTDIKSAFETTDYLYKGRCKEFNIKVEHGSMIPTYTIDIIKDSTGTHYKIKPE